MDLLLAAENAAQRSQVQQVALVRTHDQTHVGHQEHHQDLQEALRVAFGNAVADDQGEQVGANNAEDAADGSPDQPLQADQSQAPFEQDDTQPDQYPYAGIEISAATEGLNEVTSNRNDKNK